MANYINSPNMNLPVPTVNVDPGPDWANNVNASLITLDSHNHTPGSGLQITPAGMNINADLPFNTNNATLLRSSRYVSQASVLTGAQDLNCASSVLGELYWNDGSGNKVKLTAGGSPAGGAGTITGLPSGTASAAYSSGSGTFVFQQATSTAANMDVATLILRYPGSYPAPSGNYIALQSPSSLSGGYALTLPSTVAASSASFLASDTSGNLSYINVDNSTLQVSGSTVLVKTGGITNAQIASGTITTANIGAGQITNAVIASGTITNAQIASGTILSSNIASGTITGNNLVSSINLPGTAAKAGGNNLVVQNGSAGTNPVMSFVNVNGGVATAGQGIGSVIHSGTGLYTVNLLNPLSNTVTATVTPILGSQVTYRITNLTNGQVQVGFYAVSGGTATDTDFCMIIIGSL